MNESDSTQHSFAGTASISSQTHFHANWWVIGGSILLIAVVVVLGLVNRRR